MAPQYRCCWKSKLTGAGGRGEPHDKSFIDAVVEEANAQFPHLHHWAELVDDAAKAAS